MIKHLDLFAGIGGFSLAAKWLGIETTQMVENAPFCQQVLSKNFPGVPIHGDIQTFTASPGAFGIATIGFPCQDNSQANSCGKGLDGERSSLWFEARRIVAECHPQAAIVENVPPTKNRRWDAVARANLKDLGYHTEKIELSARDVGANHLRKRVFIVAYSHSLGLDPAKAKNILTRESLPKEKSSWWEGSGKPCRAVSGRIFCLPHAGALRVDDGLPSELDRRRIHALGNSVSPQVAEIVLRRVLTLAEVER